jgi:antitoxin (DNA-binding transcriptional repressor) of toxin-antitoxin stability system
MADDPMSVARRDFCNLLRRAEAGEEVWITRRGQRLARIEAIPEVAEPKPAPEDLSPHP